MTELQNIQNIKIFKYQAWKPDSYGYSVRLQATERQFRRKHLVFGVDQCKEAGRMGHSENLKWRLKPEVTATWHSDGGYHVIW